MPCLANSNTLLRPGILILGCLLGRAFYNFYFFEIAVCRPSEYFPIDIVAGAMTGTVPGPFGGVPGYIASHMCADRIKRMNISVIVFKEGY